MISFSCPAWLVFCIFLWCFCRAASVDWEALKGRAHCSLKVGKAWGWVNAHSTLLGNLSDPVYHTQKSIHVLISIYLAVPEKSDKPFPNLFPGDICQNTPWSPTCKTEMDQVRANNAGRQPFPPEHSWTSASYSGTFSLGKNPPEARGNFCLGKLHKDDPKSNRRKIKCAEIVAVSNLFVTHPVCPVLPSCFPATLGIWDADQ